MKTAYFKLLFANAINNYKMPVGEPVLLPNGGYRRAYTIKKSKVLSLNVRFLNIAGDEDKEADLEECPMSVYYIEVADFKLDGVKLQSMEHLIGVTHQSAIDAAEMILSAKDIAFEHIENVLVDKGCPMCDAIDEEVAKNAQRYIRSKKWCKKSWIDKFRSKEAVVTVSNNTIDM